MNIGVNLSITGTIVLNPPAPTLGALSLSASTIAEDQTTGTLVGNITGATTGSTITLHDQSDADMFAKDGDAIEVGAAGLDFETAPEPTITLRETLAGATNSPRDTVIPITVTDVEEGPSYGPDLLAGTGTFDSSTGWTLLGGASISGGTVQMDGSSNGLARRASAETITTGTTYHWSVDLLETDGGAGDDAQIFVGGSAIGTITAISEPGTYTGTGVSNAASQLVQLNAGIESVKKFDNFIVREVL